MPTLATHVPDDWQFADQFAANVTQNYQGRASPYLRELIEKDLSGLSIGTPQSAFSPQRIQEMRAAEDALFRIELTARRWLFAPEDKKPEMTRALVEEILDATHRGPAYPRQHDTDLIAAEEPAPAPDLAAKIDASLKEKARSLAPAKPRGRADSARE